MANKKPLRRKAAARPRTLSSMGLRVLVLPPISQRWIAVPVPPTNAMLDHMANATFLRDGSRLEMARRFNGMLEGLPKRKRRKK